MREQRKSAVYLKPGQVGLVEIDRPQIEDPQDTIIRIVRTCVCGSDLWRYRDDQMESGTRNSGDEKGLGNLFHPSQTTRERGRFGEP